MLGGRSSRLVIVGHKCAPERISGVVFALYRAMSTQAIAPERKLTRYFRTADQDIHDTFNIAKRITVETDANRLFQALTKPEYLETWITLPDDNEDTYLVAWTQPDSFRLDHYRDGRRDLMIHGGYRLCRRRKMLFTWRLSGDSTGSESLVYIGLYGNFTSTILEIHHRGFASAEDYMWQQDMWNNSLDRLAKLFER
ncbi:MAG TPA: SRPBCC domain-containing protein [Acidobacteriaceae bacterium]